MDQSQEFSAILHENVTLMDTCPTVQAYSGLHKCKTCCIQKGLLIIITVPNIAVLVAGLPSETTISHHQQLVWSGYL